MNAQSTRDVWGKLAQKFFNVKLPLCVLKSAHGFYIGTVDEEGPCSRESEEYFPSEEAATSALDTGEWTQKMDA